MRQIPSQINTAIGGGGATAVFSAFIPGDSWATSKNMFMRGFYQLTFPAGPPVPGYNILETIYCPQFGIQALPAAGPFVATTGTYSTWIQRNFIRVDPDIWMMDLGDCMQFNWANFDDGVNHVLQVPATIPPYDYTQPIQIDLQFALPGGFPGAILQPIWMEAFLEQGTNLGRLS